MKQLTFTAVVAVLVLAVGVCAQETSPDYLQARPDALEAWKDMRFGMFICWGPVSLTGHEIGWSRGRETPIEAYDKLYRRWHPKNFDATQWVKVAKDMGARYIIFLTKHHDGFCLWDTKQTEYNVMNSPLGRDVTQEVAEACKKAGIALFPYYSTCDWYHPDFPGTGQGGRTKRKESDLECYTEYLLDQSRELITHYGPLQGIWYDVPQHFDRKRGERVIRTVRGLQPSLLVNNRTGAPGDFDTPEQHVGQFNRKRPWESCITLGTQWAWKPNDHLKSYEEAIKMLVACACGDGNLALNTNPMPDGPIEARQVRHFKQIGKWMRAYGESIYETRGGPFIAPDAGVRTFGSARHKFNLPGARWWGGSTHKGNTVYLHVLRWPSDTVVLPTIERKVLAYEVLTGGKARIKQNGESIEVTVPKQNRDALDTIIKIEFDKPVHDVEPITTGEPPLTLGARASASGTWPDPPLGPDLAIDNNASTRWGGAPNSKDGWLAVDLGSEKSFSRVSISEAYDRIQEFELQIKAKGVWTTIHKGTTLGGNFSLTFDSVKARHIRLNIVKASDVPTIWEFRLFSPDVRGNSARELESARAEQQVTLREIRGTSRDTEIRLLDPQGGIKKRYRIDLTTHHYPATSANDPVIKRWESWKYGAFLCFNSNQFSGKEFCRIQDPREYAPAKLDVGQWIDTLKTAGMHYAVLTARHTSGFLLWDSPTSEFDIANSANTSDVVQAYVQACRRQGIQPGFYYCLWGGKRCSVTGNKEMPTARALILAQLYELATFNGPIPYFWIDMMNWAPRNLSAQEIYDLLKNVNPQTVVMLNQHIQRGTEIKYFPTDVLNGEMMMPPESDHQVWREVNGKRYYLPFEYEPCSQRQPGPEWKRKADYGDYVWFTYGKGRAFTPSEPFPVSSLYEHITAAYRRGAANVLLSCAPDHTGQFRPEDVEQLVALGQRLRSQ